MSTVSDKNLSLIRFWGVFGVLVMALIAGMMSFNTKVAKIEEKQATFTHEVIRAEKERFELDQSQRNIMLQLKTIEANQMHQKALLQEIKTSLK